MAKIKRKLNLFTIADYQEEQRWLEEQHRTGFKFKTISFIFVYEFEVVKPEPVVYQLDYKNEDSSAEYLQMFNDYGWEYCGQYFGWNYFRKPKALINDENEGEIFSDAASKLEMINHIYLTRMLPLAVIFFTIIVPYLFNPGLEDHFLGRYFYALYSALFVPYLIIFAYSGFKLWKLKKQIKSSE